MHYLHMHHDTIFLLVMLSENSKANGKLKRKAINPGVRLCRVLG